MNTEQKIKCPECGISVPDVPEGSGYEATLCNSCYDKTEQKHTPGSWQIANGAQLRVIPGHRRANAALIAAAPEMLELITAINLRVSDALSHTGAFDRDTLRAIAESTQNMIAKAKGNNSE